MADHTLIEWTDATWNPITGCGVVSPGCTNCYAMKLAGTRLRHHPSREGLTRPSKAGPVWTGEARFNAQWLTEPLAWKRPRKIFVCAHGDLFHEAAPDAWIDQVFAVMALAPQHTFQVLTKRSRRMLEYLRTPGRYDAVFDAMCETSTPSTPLGFAWPLPNVWLGVSAEDQARLDERLNNLIAAPAAVTFLSLEPLLGGVTIPQWALTDPDSSIDYFQRVGRGGSSGRGRIDWVIVGGESGRDARPMHPDWARGLRDQCVAADVPFFFKQWGEWAPVNHMTDEQVDRCYKPAPARDPEASRRPLVERCCLRADGTRSDLRDAMAFTAPSPMLMMAVGKRAAGRLLDGHTWDQLPHERPQRPQRARPWPIWSVHVAGCERTLVTAPSLAQARSRAWRAYSESRQRVSLAEFVALAQFTRLDAPPDPDGYAYVRSNYGVDPVIGARYRLVDEGSSTGLEGVCLYPGPCTASIHMALDGRLQPTLVHPLNVRPVEDARADITQAQGRGAKA